MFKFFLIIITNFWGFVFQSSWFGNVNEENGWGISYPDNADYSLFTVDSTITLASNGYLTADQNIY